MIFLCRPTGLSKKAEFAEFWKHDRCEKKKKKKKKSHSTVEDPFK